jgi:hypothetical protein
MFFNIKNTRILLGVLQALFVGYIKNILCRADGVAEVVEHLPSKL